MHITEDWNLPKKGKNNINIRIENFKHITAIVQYVAVNTTNSILQ